MDNARNLGAYGKSSAIPPLEARIFSPGSSQRHCQYGAVASESVMRGLEEIVLKLHERYEKLRNVDDLHYTVSVAHLLSKLTPNDHPAKSSALSNLAGAHRARYERFGALVDLETSIAALSLAVDVTPDWRPDKPLLLNNLSNVKIARFRRLDTVGDLEAAMVANTRAVELISDDIPFKPEWLGLLSNAHEVHHKRLGSLTDLDAIVTTRERAVKLTADKDPSKLSRLRALGDACMMRFHRLGTLEDLEAAVAAHRRAVLLAPDGHPDKPSLLNALGDTQRERAFRLATVNDLDIAISMQNRALELTPDDHPSKLTWRSNLGTAQSTRFVVHGAPEDLEAAIDTMTQLVLSTSDDDPSKPVRLANLGTAQHLHYEQSDSLEDLEAAIASKSRAVELTEENHPRKPSYLHDLAISQRVRFERLENMEDWFKAISSHTEALRLTPKGHTERAKLLKNLGDTHLAKTYTSHGIFGDLLSAIHAYDTSLNEKSGDPGARMRAGVALIPLLSDPLPPAQHSLFGPGFAERLLHAHQQVLELMPQIIWLGHDVHRRYEEATRLGTLVNWAVADAIAAGTYTLAIEWLESGRSVVWSQALRLRTPLEDLRRDHPELASRLLRVSQALQKGSLSAKDNSWSEHEVAIPLDTEVKSHYSLAVEYEKLLSTVRGIKGYENFLLPLSFSQLKAVCGSGFVVVINAHESRCDALILHDGGQVTHVPLPECSFDHVQQLRVRLHEVLKRSRLLGRLRGGVKIPESSSERGGRTKVPEDKNVLAAVLAEIWKAAVEPIINTIASLRKATPSDHESLPHVTWCPTGPFVFLPLHAAGIYAEGERSRSAMDRVVSSYTPTLQHLLKPMPYTQSCRVSGGNPFPNILIVSQPNTPGMAAIPNTKREAELIQSIFPASSTILNENEAETDVVLAKMTTHEWIHLACHGVQNAQDPTQSSFMLHDGPLKLSSLMNRGLPSAQIAVLSACQTATGDEKLSEEAVHLTAAMLNVGYSSVIGTMWSISDDIAPSVAKGFYEALRAQLRLAKDLQPAHALHQTIQGLRRSEDLVRWVPFVHYGL